MFTSLAASDVESICLIKQCHFLEHPYGSNFTDEILNNSEVSLRSLKERILKVDHLHLISQTKVHPSQRHVLEASTKFNIGWLRIWDNALDYGASGTILSLSVLKLLCKTVFVDRTCPVENCDFVVPPDCALCEHFLHAHTNLNIDFTSLSVIINDCSEKFLTLV